MLWPRCAFPFLHFACASVSSLDDEGTTRRRSGGATWRLESSYDSQGIPQALWLWHTQAAVPGRSPVCATRLLCSVLLAIPFALCSAQEKNAPPSHAPDGGTVERFASIFIPTRPNAPFTAR